jgi:hypothetical protein
MKKHLYKDKFVTINNDDIKKWGFKADAVWSVGTTKKTRQELDKIIEKHGLNDDEQYTVAHYNQVLYLADVIHGLCNVIQDERNRVKEVKEDFERLVFHMKKL